MRRGCVAWCVAAWLVVWAAPLGATEAAWWSALEARGFRGVVSSAGAGEAPEVYGVGVEADAVFWVGSVSKQFAAVAALKLVERGELKLDAPAAGYLGLGEGALSRGGRACTIAHLLSSTCGLPAGSKICDDVDLDEPARRAAYLRCVAQVELEFEPVARHQYANLGFGIVGLIIEQVTGQRYEDHLREVLWSPLGMTSTGVRLAGRPEAARLARGQLWAWGAGLDAARWGALDVYGPGRRGASGNIYSTAADLQRWTQALHGGEVLGAAQYAELVRVRDDEYALGLVVQEARIWHNGALVPMSYSAHVAYAPATRRSVVVLSAQGPDVSQMDAIARAMLRGESPSQLPAPDGGLELMFVVLPLLMWGMGGWLVFDAARGPRQRPMRGWAVGLIAQAGAVAFLLRSLDFYGDHGLFYGALAVVPVAGVAAHGGLVWIRRRAGARAA